MTAGRSSLEEARRPMGDMQYYIGSDGYWILQIHAVIVASHMRGASMFAPMFSLKFWVQSNVGLTIGK